MPDYLDCHGSLYGDGHTEIAIRMKPTDEKPDFKAAGLNDRDLEALALHYFDGYSLQEIGDLTGVHKASVQDRIDKCKRLLTKANIPLPKRMEQPKITGPTVSIDPTVMDSWIAQEKEIDLDD